MPTIADCKWPSLREPYLQALKDATVFILSEYSSVRGIIASGTIVRGTPDASSDLDVYVIHGEPCRQRVQKFFNGVPAEVFINPPHMVRKYFADEAAAGRPITAHMVGTGFVVLDCAPIVEELRAEARGRLESPPKAPPDLTMPRYMIACLVEDAIDVCRKDRATSQLIMSQAVDQMIRHSFIKAGRYIPRSKDILVELRKLDPELGKDVLVFLRSRSFWRRTAAASAIADKVIGVRGFFEWQTEKEKVMIEEKKP
jgi:hypothetical protein